MSDRREVPAERDQRLLEDWGERFAARDLDGDDALPEGLGVTWPPAWHRDLAAGTHSWRSSLRNNADSGAGLLVSGEDKHEQLHS